MNIFAVDYDPVKAARMLCDKHVVKMVLETAQMLSDLNHGPYKLSHKNNPCTLWAGNRVTNYLWLVEHGLALADEYTVRYGRVHKSQEVIEHLAIPPCSLPYNSLEGISPFVLVMPDKYKSDDPIESYRNFYYHTKRHFCKWKNTQPPDWFLERLRNDNGTSSIT